MNTLSKFRGSYTIVAIALATWLFSVSSRADNCDDTPRTTEEAQARQAERGALMTAAANGNVAELKRLVDAGACLQASDWLGASPLIQAVTNDHLDAVRWLLHAGANLED